MSPTTSMGQSGTEQETKEQGLKTLGQFVIDGGMPLEALTNPELTATEAEMSLVQWTNGERTGIEAAMSKAPSINTEPSAIEKAIMLGKSRSDNQV